jgi:CheY-like chemotaxis protein
MEILQNEKGCFMDNEHNRNFDLPLLIKQGNFRIRTIAEANPNLTIIEYFSSLSEFINLAPRIITSLNSIAEGKSDRYDIPFFDNLKDILIKLQGGGALLPAIDNIVKRCEESADGASASQDALNIIGEFENIYQQTLEACIEGKDDNFPGMDSLLLKNDFKKPFMDHSLKEIFIHLDQEDARRKLNVLAIDDSPVILRLIISALNKYNVHTLSHQEQLEKFLEYITPELFILDCQMPGRTGFDLVPVIRNYEEHIDTPIMFLTSLASPDYIATATRLGACDFMVKPLDENVIQKKTDQHIARKKIY